MTAYRIGMVVLIGCGALIGYTKLIWQSGFDQGADVAGCVAESLWINDGKLARDSEFCKSAKRYEDNPLWLLRRRDGDRS